MIAVAPNRRTRNAVVRAPLGVRRPRLFETVALILIGLTLAVGAVALVSLLPLQVPGAAAALVVSVAGVAIGVRHLAVGLALAAAAPLVAAVLDAPPIATWNVAVFAAFLFTLRGLPGVLVGVVVGALNLIAVGLAEGTVGVDDPQASIACVAAVAAAAIGAALRNQRLYWAQLERSRLDALAGRDAAVELGVAEERLRITRDLHDVVGHEIAVVSLHLGAAEVSLPPGTGAARGHLQAARDSVKSLLRETQQILRVLRSDDEGTSLAATPSHVRVPDLVESFRAGGLRVTPHLILDRDLPAQVSVATYRIAQEALTNAQRHSTGEVVFSIDIDDDAVRIEASNPTAPPPSTSPPSTSPPSSASGGGHGLVGMRERAAAAGGQLEVQSEADRFTVRAVLPVHERTST